MNKHFGHRRPAKSIHVAWKRKMLHDVIGGYQAYIQRKTYLLRLEFGSWLRPRAVSRLRALRARRDYKVATVGMKLDVKGVVFIRISTYKAGRGPCLYLINMT